MGLRRSWLVSILSYDSTTMNRCRDTDTLLPVRTEMSPPMFVSVHSHCCKSLVRCFCVQKKGYSIIPVSLVPCVAAFGADVVACGVSQPLSATYLPLTFAPKRQGKAGNVYRRHRPVLLLGSRRVSGDRYLAPNPSGTDFCVLKDTARYVLSNSKPCGLLPQALPRKGEGLPSEVGKPVSTCGKRRESGACAVTPLNP